MRSLRRPLIDIGLTPAPSSDVPAWHHLRRQLKDERCHFWRAVNREVFPVGIIIREEEARDA